MFCHNFSFTKTGPEKNNFLRSDLGSSSIIWDRCYVWTRNLRQFGKVIKTFKSKTFSRLISTFGEFIGENWLSLSCTTQRLLATCDQKAFWFLVSISTETHPLLLSETALIIPPTPSFYQFFFFVVQNKNLVNRRFDHLYNTHP